MNLSNSEVAEEMGTTDAAVRGLVARGLAQLSLKLARDPGRDSDTIWF